MNITILQPGKILREYIQYYWIIEGKHQSHPELIYPTGELQIILHYKNPFIDHNADHTIHVQPRSVFYGQKTRYSNVHTNNETGSIGILFFPYTASAFFPFSMHEVTDTMLNLSDHWSGWKQLEDACMCTITNRERISIIEHFLISKITFPDTIHYSLVKDCIKYINDQNGLVNISGLAARYELSERTLQRMFKSMVGISAKQYSGFKKLEYGISLCGTGQKLTDSGYMAGYYDQSDFIKTIKKYTGLTPSELKKTG